MAIDSALTLLRDLGLAARSLRRSRSFTLIAVATLALGIGANTAMFSVLDGYVLQPAPYKERARLERVFRATRQDPHGNMAPAAFLDLRAQVGGYQSIAGYLPADLSLAEPGRPAEVAVGCRASANLFATLGAAPRLGRAFRPEEETLGNHRVLVISDRFWRNRFAGDPHVLGRVVRVDGEPNQIVGVLPPDFSDYRHLSFIDVFRPLGFDAAERRDRNSTGVRVVALRAPGTTAAQSADLVARFGRRLAAEHPDSEVETRWRTVAIDDSFLPEGGEHIVLMLVGLSGFVLLIACSNLANLLLARSMGRGRELAVRAALGASRGGLLRPLFLESLLLALAGGAASLLVARWCYAKLEVMSANENGVGVSLHFDWRVMGWTFAACLLTALLFGVAPAFFVRRLDLNSTLKSGSRGATGGRAAARFRQLLVVGQFALAMVLLGGAAVFEHGIAELNNRRHGWESDRLITADLALPTTRYAGDRELVDFHRRALERVESLPGVTSASVSYSLPFFGLSEPHAYVVAGQETPQRGREPRAVIDGVSPHYFATVGTRLLAGRAFDARDTASSRRVFVVNRSMARGLFGNEGALGRHIAEAGATPPQWGEIVGVVDDVQSVFPDRAVITYQLYQPLSQAPRREVALAVRTRGEAATGTIAAIRGAMMALDPDLPVRKLQPAAKTIARANYQQGVLGTMLSGLALLGLGLAALGIYGVMARTTAQRTREFGIRLALGAQVGAITRQVLAAGGALALVGAGIGLAGAIAITRFLGAAFTNLHTDGAPVLTGVTLLLVLIALVACYVPARQASRVSPTQTMRAE